MAKKTVYIVKSAHPFPGEPKEDREVSDKSTVYATDLVALIAEEEQITSFFSDGLPESLTQLTNKSLDLLARIDYDKFEKT